MAPLIGDRHDATLQLTDLGDEAEMPNERASGVIRARLRGRPIDFLGVEHRAHDLIEELVFHLQPKTPDGQISDTARRCPRGLTCRWSPFRGRAGPVPVSPP